ncbi:MAG: helix-turn-helix domain-containing protein [Phycisphaerales bacterium]
MAKMFYSLSEAAEKLGKNADEVRAMIESGELQEFRSGDELVVKREQVDLLVGDEGGDDTGVNEILGSGESAIDLAAESSFNDDSLGVIGLSDSVVDDDSPVVDTGNDDSLVIGLEESSMGGSFSAVPTDEPSDLSAGGSVALTDSVTDAIASTGDTTAGSTSGGSGSEGGSGIGLAPLDIADDSNASEGSGVISLASESGAELPLGIDAPDSKEQTGISIFDDGLDDEDASAATIVTTDATAPDMSAPDFDAGASGSGLLDLTREGDDTSLGVDLMGGLGGSAAGVEAGVDAVPEEGALFETPDAGESDLAAAVPMAAFAEAYDGGGSGLVGGLAFGIVLSMLFTGALSVLWLLGGSGTMLFDQIGGVPWFAPAAGIAGLTLLITIIAWALGRRG